MAAPAVNLAAKPESTKNVLATDGSKTLSEPFTKQPRSPAKRSRPGTPSEDVHVAEKGHQLKQTQNVEIEQQKQSKDVETDFNTMGGDTFQQGGKFRADAGGSLRMPKKRHGRPLVQDIQWKKATEKQQGKVEEKEEKQGTVERSAPRSASASSLQTKKDEGNEAPQGDTHVTPEPSRQVSHDSGKDVPSSQTTTSDPPRKDTPTPTGSPGGHEAIRGRSQEPKEQTPGPSKASSESSRTLSAGSGTHGPGIPKPSRFGVLSVEETRNDELGASEGEETTAPPDTKESPGLTKSQRKKINKKKNKKVSGTVEPDFPEDLHVPDDSWPSLPPGPHNRSYTINGPAAAWRARDPGMGQDPLVVTVSNTKEDEDSKLMPPPSYTKSMSRSETKE